MRTFRGVAALVVLAGAMLGAGQAGAGGASSLDFDQAYLVIGNTVTGRTIFWTDQFPGTGSVEDGPYFAYLLPADRSIEPPHIPAGAIPLGRLRMSRDPGPTAMAWLTFTVPQVPAGDYNVEFCNDPCTHASVGDLYGSWAQIVPTPLDARFAAQEDRSQRRVDRLEWNLRREIRRLNRAQEGLEGVTDSQRLLTERIQELEGEVESLRRAAAQRPEEGSSGWMVLAAAAVIAGALLLRRRRPRSVPALPDAEDQTVVLPVEAGVEPLERTAELVSPRP